MRTFAYLMAAINFTAIAACILYGGMCGFISLAMAPMLYFWHTVATGKRQF